MSRIYIKVGTTELPSPVDLSIDNEILWSEDSGRDLSGLFSGDVVAEKKTLTISWGILSETELNLIKNNLIAGYIPITFSDGSETTTIESYRGTLSKSPLGTFGNVTFFKSASVKIVQR